MTGIHARLNDHVMDHGRTHLNPDGEYLSYDLGAARQGDELRVGVVDPTDNRKSKGTLYLIKQAVETGAGATEGWELMRRDGRMRRKVRVGQGALTLLARVGDSGSIRTPSIVLKPGLEIGAQLPDAPSVIVSMGAIATMSHMGTQRTIRERMEILLERLAQRN